MVEDDGKSDALILVRKLELEAYSSVVNALRAHGDLSERGKTILDELRDLFSVSQERHKAEMRRVANDDELASLAEKAMGNITYENWLAEGKRMLPPFPRIDPETAYTRLANAASKKQVKIEMAKFFEAKDMLERAVKKQEESRASLLESDRMETKRRLAELAPAVHIEVPATSDDTAATAAVAPTAAVTKPTSTTKVNTTHRKRVRVCSPQPSPGVDAELGLITSEMSTTAKVKKPREPKEPGGKKQRLRMSPSGNSSVQENVPADEANGSLPPSSLAISSPVKVSTDSLDPISPLATPGQLVRNIDLFANQSDHPHHNAVGDISSASAEKFNSKSSPKSPKPPKEKKPKQTKKQAKAAAAAAAAAALAAIAPVPLKPDSVAENAAATATTTATTVAATTTGISSSSYSASPPVTLSGVGVPRPTPHSSLMQQQAAAVAAAAAAHTTTATHQPHPPPHSSHPQPPPQPQQQTHQQPPSTVVISSTSHGQVVVSSPPAQGNLVQASPGKAAQSSYHNYAPPFAPLSINPMRLVGRAGPGVAISTAAASPPSVAVNTLRPPDPSGNIPLIRLTPQNSQQQPQQRPPLILATGNARPTAILTPGAPGVPGVLTIRSHRPTLTPVTTSTPANVRPSIVIHQAPMAGGQPAVVMRRVGPAVPASAALTSSSSVSSVTANNVPTLHSSISATSVVSTLGQQQNSAAANRPLIISSAPGANGSVLVINNKQQIPTTRPTILTTPTPPPQQPPQQIQPQPQPQPPQPQQQQQTMSQVVQQPQQQQQQPPIVVSSASLPNFKATPMTNFSYASHFQVAAKQVNDLYAAECDMSSPPAVGAESVVETSHDLLTNGNNSNFETIAGGSNNFDNGINSIQASSSSSNTPAGLVLLQQAAAAIGDSPTGASVAELSNFMVDSKDLADQELAHYEDVVAEANATYHGTGTSITSGAPSQDAELCNEDLMMAIMNSNPARQSQPS